MTIKSNLRRFTALAHLWVGLFAGAFVCLMGVTGAIVALRPQIASTLSPRAPKVAACQAPIDWNRAVQQITTSSGAEINRIYAPAGPPTGGDTRYQIRLASEGLHQPKYLIYDACSATVLGPVDFAWMDWTIDLHHNLLAGKLGRSWTGAIAIVLLFASLSGVLIWMLGNSKLATAFRVEMRLSRRTPRQLHRSLGLVVMVVLTLQAFTGLWMAFPQTMRGMLAAFTGQDRPVKAKRKDRKNAAPGASVGLQAWITAAYTAIPDGQLREVRFPEGKDNVQIRMWRRGDFRETGNNIVSISGASANVISVDRYSDQPASNRFVQAMTALHYNEWGGIPVRLISAIAGLLTPVFYITGILMWWYTRPRRTIRSRGESVVDAREVMAAR